MSDSYLASSTASACTDECGDAAAVVAACMGGVGVSVNNFTTCRDGTSMSRLCRLPLSIHKIRKVAWYRPWFEQLRKREPAHLAELMAAR